MDIAELLQLRDSGSSAVDSGNAAERNKQFNRILVALEALGSAFGTSFIGGGEAEDYVPVVTAQAGTFTAATATGRFLRVGTFCWVSLAATITTVGTGSGFAMATLPFTAAGSAGAQNATWPGRENVSSGIALYGQVYGAATQVAILKYDGTGAWASGNVLFTSGWYEVEV